MLALLCGALLAATPPAPAPVKLASPAWKFVGLDSTKGEFFADYLAQQITIQGGVQVVTNSEINSLLGFEQQKAMLGCSDSTACLAELSGALGVDGLIVGSLAKIGEGMVANLKVIKAGDGKLLAIHSKRLAGETQLLDWLTDTAGVIAGEVTAALRPDARAEPRVSTAPPVSRPSSNVAPAGSAPTSYPLRGWSWAPATVGALAMAGGVMTWSSAKGVEQNLRSGEFVTRYEEVEALRESGFKLQLWAYTLVPVGVAALGTAAWMFFAPGRGGPTAAVFSDGNTTAVVFGGQFE